MPTIAGWQQFIVINFCVDLCSCPSKQLYTKHSVSSQNMFNKTVYDIADWQQLIVICTFFKNDLCSCQSSKKWLSKHLYLSYLGGQQLVTSGVSSLCLQSPVQLFQGIYVIQILELLFTSLHWCHHTPQHFQGNI